MIRKQSCHTRLPKKLLLGGQTGQSALEKSERDTQ